MNSAVKMSTIPLKTSDQPAKKTEHVNRACEPCRLLKVRCLPSLDPLAARCQRCTKNGRTCHYAAPQKRRPRKRTDTRVAELEREVRAMRSLLNKSKQSPSGESNQDSIGTLDEEGELGDSMNKGPLPNVTLSSGIHGTQGHWGGSEGDYDQSDTGAEKSPDVIERDLICLSRAVEFFDHYNNNMIQHAPIVAFRPDETADSLRVNKPVLFLTVLTAAAGQKDQLLYTTLHEELLHVFADRYIINCNKSLELVQAFAITALWLYPPDDFRALKFYQFVHMAASMALDIGQPDIVGSGQKYHWPAVPTDHFPKSTEEAFKDMEGCYPTLVPRAVSSPEEPLVVESKRTFLACYLLCSSVSMSLRRPNMLSYSSFTSECIDFLEKSPHALPSDKHLIIWVRMQHIAEECGNSFSFDDPSSRIAMSDPRMQVTLKGFENRFEEYRKSLDPSLLTSTLAIHYYMNKIFLQEYATMVNNSDDLQAPQLQNMTKAKAKPISTASANAIMTIIESAHFLLEAFLSQNDATLKCYPVINYVRMCYAILLLIKMFSTATFPNSELGKILDAETLKVDHYIRAVLSRINNITEYRVASKFFQIVLKVAIWHYQHATSTSLKLGQDTGQLVQPLLNLVVDERKKGERKKEGTDRSLGTGKPPSDIGNGQCLPPLEPEHSNKFSNPPGPKTFNLEAFSYDDSTPSGLSMMSGSDSTYARATNPTPPLTMGLSPGAPGVANVDQGLDQQWFIPSADLSLGLLPTDMDIDIFALSEGLEYSAEDFCTLLPADDAGMYTHGFGNPQGPQGWNWDNQ